MSEDICGLYLSIGRDVQRVWGEANSPLQNQVLPNEISWIIGYIDESKFLRATNEAALADAIDEDVRQFGSRMKKETKTESNFLQNFALLWVNYREPMFATLWLIQRSLIQARADKQD